MNEPRKCDECGEWMKLATVRCVVSSSPRFYCAKCMGERGQAAERRYPQEAADIQYHGGKFHNGEW